MTFLRSLRCASLSLAALLPAQGTRAQPLGGIDAGVGVIDAAAIETDGSALASVDAPDAGWPVESAVTPEEAPVEVAVRGGRSSRARLIKSADAVTVVSLVQARKRSSDLGEVLSRVAGVSIRRYGGLGSEFRLSINGLFDSAIRVFVDTVPIDRVYALGLANIPVNLIDDVEVYRGVVPLRFGADALGGAINLVRPPRYETAAQASYQVGSFGVHRATLTGRYRHDETGIIGGVELFYDRAENDYFIDVSIPDARGQLSKARIRKHNDDYQAYGVAAEVGVVDQPWARKLILRGFRSAQDKGLAHNIVMSAPYGEVRYGSAVTGAIASYENTFAHRFDVDATASYSYLRTDFEDKSMWVYDWRGQRVRQRAIAGEIEAKPRDLTNWQHGTFGRLTLGYRIKPNHVLNASLSPTFSSRTGNDREQKDPSARDPLSARRTLLRNVIGVAYTLGLGTLARAPAEPAKRRLEHHRFENVLFAKSYVYRADAEEPLPGGVFVHRKRDENRFGAGDSLRFTLLEDWLWLKTSYEYAVRLPDVDEVFGNGFTTLANLLLRPELSHNANFEIVLDKRQTRWGDFWVDVNLFARVSDRLIVLLGNDRFFGYQNVYRARTFGVENTVKWTSPGKYVTLDGQLTYTDQRNASERGSFADYKGDRIPNRPWLTGSSGGYLHFEDVLVRLDVIEPFYQARFVGEFFRGWESLGTLASKQVIPRQISHDVGLTYSLSREGRGTMWATFEVQNLTDARLYDSFGVQRPSRGYYLKLTGSY